LSGLTFSYGGLTLSYGGLTFSYGGLSFIPSGHHITFISTVIGMLLMRNDRYQTKRNQAPIHHFCLPQSVLLLSVYFHKLRDNKKQMVREIKTDIKKHKRMLPKHYNSYIKL